MKHEQGCITTEAERRIRAESLEEIAYLRKTDLPRRKLPISEQRPQIEQQLREHDVILVEAPPGAGKSLDLGVMALQVFPHARVAMTQPRRDAAEGVCLATAARHNLAFGKDVCFSTSEFHGNTKETRLQIQTTGILLNKFKNDPLLEYYDVVIIDEAHERSLDIDVTLGLLKRANRLRKQANKKPISIVVASATLNQAAFKKFFDLPESACIETEGRTHALEKNFINDTEKFETDPITKKGREVNYTELAARKAYHLLHTTPRGDILIFMPGNHAIKTVQDSILNKLKNNNLRTNVEVLTLHGENRQHERSYVLKGKEPGDRRRRVIISTNIAETSVTVPDICHVIDSCRKKEKRLDTSTGLETLTEVATSKAESEQRAGRAGRLEAGTVHRLITTEEFAALGDHAQPDMERLDKAGVVLRLIHTGIKDVENFDYIHQPSKEHLTEALHTLTMLGAITPERELTAIGKEMAELPLTPRLARVVVAARELGCVKPAVAIAALIERGGVFQKPRRSDYEREERAYSNERKSSNPSAATTAHDLTENEQALIKNRVRQTFDSRQQTLKNQFTSDWLMYYHIFDEFQNSSKRFRFCEENGLDFDALEQGVKNYFKILKELRSYINEDTSSQPEKDLALAILAGFAPDHLVKQSSSRHGVEYIRLDRGDNSVRINSSSVCYNNKPGLAVCLSLSPGQGERVAGRGKIVGTEFKYAVGVHPVSSTELKKAIPHLIEQSASPENCYLDTTGAIQSIYNFKFKRKDGTFTSLPPDTIHEYSRWAVEHFGMALASGAQNVIDKDFFQIEANRQTAATLADLFIRSRGTINWENLSTWFTQRLGKSITLQQAYQLGKEHFSLHLDDICDQSRREAIEREAPTTLSVDGVHFPITYSLVRPQESAHHNAQNQLSITIDFTTLPIDTTYRAVTKLCKAGLASIKHSIPTLTAQDTLSFALFDKDNYRNEVSAEKHTSLDQLFAAVEEKFIDDAFKQHSFPKFDTFVIQNFEPLPDITTIPGAVPVRYAVVASGQEHYAYPALLHIHTADTQTDSLEYKIQFFKNETDARNKQHVTQEQKRLHDERIQRKIDRETIQASGKTMLEDARDAAKKLQELLDTLYYSSDARDAYHLDYAAISNLRETVLADSINLVYTEDSDPRQALTLIASTYQTIEQLKGEYLSTVESIQKLQPLYTEVQAMVDQKLNYSTYQDYGLEDADYQKLYELWKSAEEHMTLFDRYGRPKKADPKSAEMLLRQLQKKLTSLTKKITVTYTYSSDDYHQSGVAPTGAGLGGLFDRARKKPEQNVEKPVTPKPAVEVKKPEQSEPISESDRQRFSDDLSFLKTILDTTRRLADGVTNKHQPNGKEKELLSLSEKAKELQKSATNIEREIAAAHENPARFTGKIQTIRTGIESTYKRAETIFADYDRTWITKYQELWKRVPETIQNHVYAQEFIREGMATLEQITTATRHTLSQKIAELQKKAGVVDLEKIIDETLSTL